MTKTAKTILWALLLFAVLLIHVCIVLWYRRSNLPPPGTATVGQVLEWTGRPCWVARYTSPTATYYEIGKRVPAGILMLTLPSGAPSYTVDHNGRFVGWSPDSGDVHTPDVLRSDELKRESMDVDEFIKMWH